MPVAIVLREGRDIARTHDLLARVIDQHRLARQHHHQLVLAFVPVTLAGPGAGLQFHVARAKIAEPRSGSKPPVPAVLDHVGIDQRIAGGVGLRDRREIEFWHGRHLSLVRPHRNPYAGAKP